MIPEHRRRLTLVGAVTQPRIPTSSTPESPCVRDCCLDEAEVCMGCGRSLQEILRWHAASPEEREVIRTTAKLRLDEQQAGKRW